jgi:hypothetical protein
MIFIWYGAFIALTMSMLDYKAVFSALVSNLTESKVTFGLLYPIMISAPYAFNIILSSLINRCKFKKGILLLGIYLRSFAGTAYSDIIGKPVKRGQRGKLFASKQFATSIFSFLGGMAN